MRGGFAPSPNLFPLSFEGEGDKGGEVDKMIGDPNWLYSTIAQSSAAIVAIIGGFITHSVLTLSAEKRSLRHQLADKETLLKALKEEEQRLSEEYETMRVYEFIDTITDEITKEDELPSLEVVMQHHPETRKLDAEILKQEYEKTSKLRREARQFIGRHSKSIDVPNSIPFGEWISKNRLNISAYDPEILEQEYDRLVIYEKERQAQEYQKAHPFIIHALEVPQVSPALNMPQISLYEQRKLGSVDRLGNVKYEISALEREIANLDARLSTFSYPPYLGGGLTVLGYLAAVGILLPVFVIGYELYNITLLHNLTLKNLTIALFSIGITLIFGYIISLITELRRK